MFFLLGQISQTAERFQIPWSPAVEPPKVLLPKPELKYPNFKSTLLPHRPPDISVKFVDGLGVEIGIDDLIPKPGATAVKGMMGDFCLAVFQSFEPDELASLGFGVFQVADPDQAFRTVYFHHFMAHGELDRTTEDVKVQDDHLTHTHSSFKFLPRKDFFIRRPGIQLVEMDHLASPSFAWVNRDVGVPNLIQSLFIPILLQMLAVVGIGFLVANGL